MLCQSSYDMRWGTNNHHLKPWAHPLGLTLSLLTVLLLALGGYRMQERVLASPSLRPILSSVAALSAFSGEVTAWDDHAYCWPMITLCLRMHFESFWNRSSRLWGQPRMGGNSWSWPWS